MTFWGEPEWVHMQNMEQLHAHELHENVTENSTTSGHKVWQIVHTSTRLCVMCSELMRDTRTHNIRAASDLRKIANHKQTPFHPATALGRACSGLPRLFLISEFFFRSLVTSGNHTLGSRFYSDFLDTWADSVCIHQLIFKPHSKAACIM